MASLLWGTTGTAASFLPHSVSPLAVGASTMTLGGAGLLLTSAAGALRVVKDAAVRPFLVVGALGVFVYPLAFYSGMNLAGVAVGNVIALGSGPVFAALLEWVVGRERTSRRWASATVFAVAGIVLLPLGVTRPGTDAGSATLAGALLGLLAGAAYATYTFAAARVISFPDRGHSGRNVMGAMFGLGAVLLLPVLILAAGPAAFEPPSIAIGLYLAAGPMFVAYRLVGVALSALRSSEATTIALIEPVVATVLAVVVVGERLTLLGLLGIALILAGVVVVSSARRGRIARLE